MKSVERLVRDYYVSSHRDSYGKDQTNNLEIVRKALENLEDCLVALVLAVKLP